MLADAGHRSLPSHYHYHSIHIASILALLLLDVGPPRCCAFSSSVQHPQPNHQLKSGCTPTSPTSQIAPTSLSERSSARVAMSRSARIVLLSVLILLADLHHTHSLTAVDFNLTNIANPPPLSSLFNHTSIRTHYSTAQPTDSSIHPTIDSIADESSSSISTVRGCVSNFGNGTIGCGLTSTLTITGSGFTAPAVLEVAGHVNCTLSPQAVISSTRILAPICPYYWPQQTFWDIRIITNNTSARLASAITFANTAPVITRITSSTCTVPPYNGCDPSDTNLLTVIGRGFLSPPLPLINLYIWLGSSYLGCFTILETIQFNQFICFIAPFRWIGGAPRPNQYFDVVAAVPDADWMNNVVQSNFLFGIVSFSNRTASSSGSSSSSSTGGVSQSSVPAPPPTPPVITRVSGCEDGFNDTRNCPYYYPTPIMITIFGSYFRRSSILSAWIAGQRCLNTLYYPPMRVLCSWNTSSVAYNVTGTSPLMVSLNTTFGWVNASSLVSVDAAAEQRLPVIDSVSGCQSYDGLKTSGCDRSHTLTLWGQAFARYVPANLLVLFHSIPCTFSDNDPLAITCSLRDTDLSDLPRDLFIPVQLQLGGAGSQRISTPVPYVAWAADGPVVGSTGQSTGGSAAAGGMVDEDELVGMKLALLSLMILSFVVLLIALVVWATGWWMAHRRSYVSQHGQAAVDARQVLLQ